ncbi:MAG: serine acetyltransferase [Betaproteobacteria bacterium]|nr:serine acetyltransferase [Betaproteobacteria bacterium]
MNDVRELPEAIRGKDPAARSNFEVLCLYPGVKAVMLHRCSHALWQMEARFPARLVSEMGRFLTGIEIHPGAELGRRVVIDHGMGTVIGETAIVGDDVLLYQNVTLGSTRSRQGRRHPIVERGAVIGAGATVVGAVTIGEEAKVGAGAVVARNVDSNTVVTGVPALPRKPREPESRTVNDAVPLRGRSHRRR